MYDEERGVHYMFGGNPGGKEMSSAAGRARLGDFWRLELQRPRPAELQRKLVLAVRRARYQELAPDPLQAVRYLQVPCTLRHLRNWQNISPWIQLFYCLFPQYFYDC